MQIPIRQEFIRVRLQVQSPDQRVVCVDTDQLALHPDAANVLEEAARGLAGDAGMPVSVIHDRLFQYVLALVPSGTLLLVLSVPERDMEITVELPSPMWKMVAAQQEEGAVNSLSMAERGRAGGAGA